MGNVDYPMNMASHLWGKNHVKKLHQALGYHLPPPQQIELWNQYWKNDSGQPEPYYYFNHVTGKQGWAIEAPDRPFGLGASLCIPCSQPAEAAAGIVQVGP